MTRQYQRTPREASEETPARPAVPARVTVPLGEITANVQEGLLALVVGTGLQVMQAMFDADVAAVAGPRGKHDPARVAGRHGCGPGSVTLGGRRVPVTRPRVHAADRSGELPVPSYEVFTSTEMLGGLSTRRYGLGLEPVGEQVTETAKGTSKSAISRRFVQRTETTLAELLARPLGELDLIALMVDGVHFGEHLCVVALGIDADGTKHPLALVERSTENTATVRGLLGGCPTAASTSPARCWS